ncbi:MAG: four helix bundle protein [Thermoanaerobaculia bacterium]
MKKFEDLAAFDAAVDLMVAVYRVTEQFPVQERYGLVAQMRRASVSVVSHIAEGQGRLTFGEWRQMLSQGRGSLFEVEAQLIAAHRLKYLDDATYAQLRTHVSKTGSPLIGLIRYVQRCERRSRTPPPRNPAT